MKRVLHREQSALQDILVFDSTDYGRVLVLDGVVQLTERDEFAYQEMLTHIPMCSHPSPRNVCVVGGGDGGIVREVLRHAAVERVTLCEIDERVVAVCRKYLPSMASALDDPRVQVVHADGAKYLTDPPRHASFDVIITDSSDPVGPAESLFEDGYTAAVHGALAAGGLMASQGECQWLHLDIIKQYMGAVRRHFPRVAYAYTTVPTYPSGQIGIVVAAKDAGSPLNAPLRKLPSQVQQALRYYSAAIHSASFVLPEFARRALECDDGEEKEAER